jgi:hypothetical protein
MGVIAARCSGAIRKDEEKITPGGVAGGALVPSCARGYLRSLQQAFQLLQIPMPIPAFRMSSLRPCSIIASLLALLLLLSCTEKRQAPVSNEDALPVVNALVASVGIGNRGYFDSKVDTAAFIERSFGEFDLGWLEKSVIQRGMSGQMSLTGFVLENVSAAGSYTFLRLHTVDGETRALMRVVTSTGELNYHDIVLGYGLSRDVMIKDVFTYRIGALTSGIISEYFRHTMESDDHPPAGAPPSLLQAIDTMARRRDDGEHASAIEYFMSMAPEDRRTKIGLRILLSLGGAESTEAYRRAIDEYLHHHPRDTGAAILRIDRAIIEKDFKGTIAAIDGLNTIVGGDPYLEHLRGWAMTATGDTVGGLARMRKGIDAEPKLQRLYWPYIDVLVAQGKYPEAGKVLSELSEKTNASNDDIDYELMMRSSPDYDRFRASPGFAEWKRK